MICTHCGIEVDDRLAHYAICEKRPLGPHDVVKVVEKATATVSESARRLAVLAAHADLITEDLKMALEHPEMLLDWLKKAAR